MNKLIISKIDEILNEETLKGLTKISKIYNIDLNDLLNTWNDHAVPIVKKFQVKKSVASSVAESVESSDEDEGSQKSGKCSYKFIKGKNEGNFCDCSAKLNSKYCSKHMKYEEKGQKEKTSLPKNKVVDKKIVQKPTIRLNEEIGKFWHKESQLVFKSSSEKIVIGAYRDKILRKLTDEDVETCKQFGFKFKLEDDEFNKELEESGNNRDDILSSEELEKKRLEEEKKLKELEVKKQKDLEENKANEAKRQKELERKKLEEVKKRNEFEKNKHSLEKVKELEKKNKKTVSECVTETNNCAKNVEDLLEDMFLGSEEEREDIDSDNEEFEEFEDEEDVLDEETFEEED